MARDCAPRLQHYVTKAYLDGFLEPGQEHLYCYGRKKSEPYRSAPDKLARIRDYYSYKMPDGTQNDSLEHRIEKEVESPGILIIRDLCAEKTRLKWQQREILSRLVGLQKLRVPYEREFMDRHSKESITQSIEQLKQHSKGKESADPAMMVAISPFGVPPPDHEWFQVKQSELIAEQERMQADPEGFSRENFIDLAFSLAKVFEHMKWTVCFTSRTMQFVTSDCPVVTVFRNQSGLPSGLLSSDCEIFFPLSGKALLKMEHDTKLANKLAKIQSLEEKARMLNRQPEIGITWLDDQEIQLVNEQHADHAYKWVCSGPSLDWLPNRMRGRSRNPRQVFMRQERDRSFHFTLPD
jgi:hypothetical protein